MKGHAALMDAPLQVGSRPLEIADVVKVARGMAPIELTPGVLERVAEGRRRIEELASSGCPVYGVSTGFGALATRYIEPAKRHPLQRSLVRSHAAGSGRAVEPEVVRAMMLLRLATLCSGMCRRPRRDRARVRRAARTPGITPVRARVSGRSAARAIWRRSLTAPSCSWARARRSSPAASE